MIDRVRRVPTPAASSGSPPRRDPRKPGAKLIGELPREILWSAEFGSGVLTQVIGELGEDPAAPAGRDPGLLKLGVKVVQVGHATTASIVAENTRQRSRLTPNSFSPRLVML